MKNLKKLLIVASVLFALGGCDNDIIELTERDRLPAALAVANLGGIESSLSQVKERARSIHENNDIALYKQCGTDIVTAGTHLGDVADGGMEAMMTYSSSLSALSPQIEQLFNGINESITSCNTVIQFADNFTPVSQDEEDRLAKSVGEAYALRAYLYLEMVQRFDNVVIFTRILEEGDPIQFDVTLSPPADVPCSAVYPFCLRKSVSAVTLSAVSV